MTRRSFHTDDGEDGICDTCGTPCRATEVDLGIGSYEYWGSRGTHHDYQMVSPCCHDRVVPGGQKVVRRTIHTARKDHKDGIIKAGDKYSLTIYRTWRKDGPSWIHTVKKKLASQEQPIGTTIRRY